MKTNGNKAKTIVPVVLAGILGTASAWYASTTTTDTASLVPSLARVGAAVVAVAVLGYFLVTLFRRVGRSGVDNQAKFMSVLEAVQLDAKTRLVAVRVGGRVVVVGANDNSVSPVTAVDAAEYQAYRDIPQAASPVVPFAERLRMHRK